MGASFVRVTLEKAMDVDELVLRYGTEDATVPMQMESDEYVNNVDRPRPRVIPGKPITWTLSMGNPVIMPSVAAMNYFGNWDIPDNGAIPGFAGEGKVEVTWAYEKRRLAMLWGGYGTMTRTEAGLDNVVRGYMNLPKNATPPIPRVAIEMLNSNMQGTGIVYDPWAKFKWESELSARRLQKAASANGLISVTAEQLSSMIAAEVAKALAPQRKSASQ